MKSIYLRNGLRKAPHITEKNSNVSSIKRSKKHLIRLSDEQTFCNEEKQNTAKLYMEQSKLNVDAALNQILSWNVSNLHAIDLFELNKNEYELSSVFLSQQDYVKKFLPLILEECKSVILESTLEKKKIFQSVKIIDLCRTSNSFFTCIQPINYINQEFVQLIQTYDLLYLVPDSQNDEPYQSNFDLNKPYLLALVENEQKNNSVTTWTLRLSDHFRQRDNNLAFNLQSLIINSIWKIGFLTSLVTYVREIQSIFFSGLCEIFPVLLNPMAQDHCSSSNKKQQKETITRLVVSKMQAAVISNYHLNESQFAALNCALCNEKKVSIIQGPPGSGKTTTILAILATILNYSILKNEKQRILICAPSNAAVDEIASRILKSGFPNFNSTEKIYPTCIRLGNESRVTKPEVKQLLISNFQSNEENIVKEPKTNEISSTLNASISLIRNTRYTIQQKFKMCDLIFTTLSNCAVDHLTSFTPLNFVIIDEAAQAVELSCLIPLRWDPQRLVLIGDPQQLPATVKSTLAKKFFYERSLFERLSLCGLDVNFLKDQYRMRLEIAKFPSMYFYDNRVVTPKTVAERKLLPFHKWSQLFGPFLFFDLPSTETKNSATQSYSNVQEALFIIGLLKIFVKNFIASKRDASLSLSDIAIITPYKEQVQILMTILYSQVDDNWQSLEVCTIDAFQGREKKIIIFSCVRSNSNMYTSKSGALGFLTDLRRLNVAITRARESLWIVGCAKTLSKNIAWKALIQHAKDSKTSLNLNLKNHAFDIFDESLTPYEDLSAYVDVQKYCTVLANDLCVDINKISCDQIIAFFLSSCKNLYKEKSNQF